MGRKGRKKRSAEEPEDGEWVQRNAELLQQYAAFPNSHDSVQADVMQRALAGAEVQRQGGPASGERLQAAMAAAGHGPEAGEAASYPLQSVRVMNQQVHRLLGEGLLVTGFEPQRHSTMVLGRPVQAAGRETCLCHWFMLWCCMCILFSVAVL